MKKEKENEDENEEDEAKYETLEDEEENFYYFLDDDELNEVAMPKFVKDVTANYITPYLSAITPMHSAKDISMIAQSSSGYRSDYFSSTTATTGTAMSTPWLRNRVNKSRNRTSSEIRRARVSLAKPNVLAPPIGISNEYDEDEEKKEPLRVGTSTYHVSLNDHLSPRDLQSKQIHHNRKPTTPIADLLNDGSFFNNKNKNKKEEEDEEDEMEMILIKHSSLMNPKNTGAINIAESSDDDDDDGGYNVNRHQSTKL